MSDEDENWKGYASFTNKEVNAVRTFCREMEAEATLGKTENGKWRNKTVEKFSYDRDMGVARESSWKKFLCCFGLFSKMRQTCKCQQEGASLRNILTLRDQE